MIEFTCPGCLSRCVANEAFSKLKARCVVCGAFIRIPVESGEVAFPLGPLPSGPLPSKPSKPKPQARAAAKPRPELLVLSDDSEEEPSPQATSEGSSAPTPEYLLQTEEEPQPETAKAPKAAKAAKNGKTAKKSAKAGTPSGDWGGLAAEADAMDDAEAAKAASLEAEGSADETDSQPARTPAQKRKRLILLGAGCLIVSLALACAVVFLRDDSPKVSPNTRPAAASDQKPSPAPSEEPPKKEEPKKEEPKKEEPKASPSAPLEVAPPPRVSNDPVRVVVAQMLSERGENPANYDTENRGKLFLLRGTYARVSNGALLLAEGADDERAVACLAPKASTKRNAVVEPPAEAAALQPGQAVIVRGWYAGNLTFTDCRVVATSGPADDDYRGKDIELVGVAGVTRVDPDEFERFPTVTLEPPATDCPVNVRCLFRLTERNKLAKLRPGQVVTIRGRCEGRSFRVVRLHDCTLMTSDAPPAAGAARVTAERFFSAYEVDLLPFDRPNPAAPPVRVTTDQIAGAYAADPVAANASYRYKIVEVAGKVVERRPATRTIILETGTSQKYQVVAAFTASKFEAAKDKPDLTVRGVCVGVWGKYIRVENADAATESSSPDPAGATRTAAEFLPLQPGRELTYDLLTPVGVRDNAITRFSLKVTESDIMRLTQLKSGTFPKATLFGDPPGQPKWTRDLVKQKVPGQDAQFRVSDELIEVRDKPAPPAQPSSWWDPVLKLGVRKGETWASTMPDGRTVTYTVASFGKDAAGRPTVELLRVVKDPKSPNVWEESTITYARGVGEVRRVVARQSTGGKAFTLREIKLVEPDAAQDER